MSKEVKEMYEGDGVAINTKYLLIIYSDGTLKLKRYYGDRCADEDNPVLIPAGKGLRLQFGTPSVKTSIPFTKYYDGSVDKNWTKIK